MKEGSVRRWIKRADRVMVAARMRADVPMENFFEITKEEALFHVGVMFKNDDSPVLAKLADDQKTLILGSTVRIG